MLVVVSDGGDNASSVTRAQVLAAAQASNAVIYTIALVDPMDSDADPGFLASWRRYRAALRFGPVLSETLRSILQRVARDIRNMYTIGYVPADGDASRSRSAPCEEGRAPPRECRGPATERTEARSPDAPRLSRGCGRGPERCSLSGRQVRGGGSSARSSRSASAACSFTASSRSRRGSISAPRRRVWIR